MLQITDLEIKRRLGFDNPWWESGAIDPVVKRMPKRAYFPAFMTLVDQPTVKRAVVLMGPRRVGKTILLTQIIGHFIQEGVPPKNLFYVSVDTPTYTGLRLERVLQMFMELHGHKHGAPLYVIFDEIQYHTDWERHLKSLVDSYPNIRFIASGSAAAALKMKSNESGAGRFTDFLLPPLNFAEFLRFIGRETELLQPNGRAPKDIHEFNREFINYLNFGGFPEAVLDQTVRDHLDRFVASDILDKVLLRDLPNLYGVGDTQELKRFFTILAYNTGLEVSYEGLSQSSGVAKNTLRRYLDFLEAAFLIRRLYRIDQSARRFKRATQFKVYLTSASLRAALFGPMGGDDSAIGKLVETAVYAHFLQSDMADSTFYARWPTGEVDFVTLERGNQRPLAALESKWSDRIKDHSSEAKSYADFCTHNGLPYQSSRFLTRSFSGTVTVNEARVWCLATSAFCFLFSKQAIEPVLNSGRHPHGLFPELKDLSS